MKREYNFRGAKRGVTRLLPSKAERRRHTKIRITIHLDQDVLEFFKTAAAKPGASPYQTHINRVLREHAFGHGQSVGDTLLADEQFITTLSERIARYLSGARAKR